MNQTQIYNEIFNDVSTYVIRYNDYRKSAYQSAYKYDTCISVMDSLNTFIEFVKKYLQYDIKIQTSNDGNQYTPDEIIGFSIKKLQ